MAIIPLKQTITVIPASDELTEFDTPATGEPYTRKCRYVETVALVKSMVDGKEAVSKATIMFSGYEPVTERTPDPSRKPSSTMWTIGWMRSSMAKSRTEHITGFWNPDVFLRLTTLPRGQSTKSRFEMLKHILANWWNTDML